MELLEPIQDGDPLIAYLDEAGISASEPNCIVGGILMPLNSRVQARVRDRVEQVIRQCSGSRDPPHFHATDVFSKRGAFSDWSIPERKRLMVRLAMIPREFGLMVFAGDTDKTTRPYLKENAADKITNDQFTYSLAFGSAMAHIQSFMSRLVPQSKCEVIVEDNRELREWAKFAYAQINDPNMEWKVEGDIPRPGPLTHLREPRFEPKSGDALLQLADLTVFVLRRLLLKKADAQALFSLFEEQMYIMPHQRRTELPMTVARTRQKLSLRNRMLNNVSGKALMAGY